MWESLMRFARRLVRGGSAPLKKQLSIYIKYSKLTTHAEYEEFCRYKKVPYTALYIGGADPNERITVVARYFNHIVGHTSIYRMWQPAGLTNVFSGGTWVHPLFRRLGVGTKILTISLKEATNRGQLPVFGSVAYDNDRSLAMCHKVGFINVDRPDLSFAIENAYLMNTGSAKRQVIVMYDGRALQP